MVDNLRIDTGYKSVRGKIVMGSLAVFFFGNTSWLMKIGKLQLFVEVRAKKHTGCCDWQHSAKYSLMYGKK